jgi:hypothetical protein
MGDCHLKDFLGEGGKLARGAYIKTYVCVTHGLLIQPVFLG